MSVLQGLTFIPWIAKLILYMCLSPNSTHATDSFHRPLCYPFLHGEGRAQPFEKNRAWQCLIGYCPFPIISNDPYNLLASFGEN